MHPSAQTLWTRNFSPKNYCAFSGMDITMRRPDTHCRPPPLERLKRLFPTPFLYRQRPAGKLGGYDIQEEGDVRYHKTSCFTYLTRLHGPIQTRTTNKTFLETHPFYISLEDDAEAKVLYPIGLRGKGTCAVFYKSKYVRQPGANVIYCSLPQQDKDCPTDSVSLQPTSTPLY